MNEALFQRLAPHSELIVVPRTTHLVTAMRPHVFNAVVRLAVATIEAGVTAPGTAPGPETDGDPGSDERAVAPER